MTMPACDHIKFLLGPFDDGELEPHEMEDVALHVVGCQACKAALDGYRSLGVALRDSLPPLAMGGFTAAVLKRIDRAPHPLWMRWKSFVDTITEHVGGALSLVAAGAVAALLTSWLITPYAQRWLHHSSNNAQTAAQHEDNRGTSPQLAGVNRNPAPDQSEPPMITLSNDPTTTVIWLPNQP